MSDDWSAGKIRGCENCLSPGDSRPLRCELDSIGRFSLITDNRTQAEGC